MSTPAVQTARRTRVWVLDHATALLLLLAVPGAIAEVVVYSRDGESTAVLVAVQLVALSALVLRHRRPLTAVALGCAGVCVASRYSDVSQFLYVAFVTPLVVAFAYGRQGPVRHMVLGVALLLVASLAPRVLDTYDDTVGSFAGNGLLLGLGPYVLGRFLYDRERLHASLRARREEVEAGRERAQARAVRAERDRIAAELHDVISHALSGMVVQATASRALVASDPGRAGRAFAAVEDAGREALAEVRGLLGVLRSDEDVERRPLLGLDALPALAERAGRSGIEVVLHADPDVGRLPEGTDLLAYRVVQDAIGAAREPGGAARAQLDVRRTGGRLTIEVRDDGPASRPLGGARERVRLLGGDLIARRTDDGGHLLRVALPVGESA